MTLILISKRQSFWLLALFICNASMLAASDGEKAQDELMLESVKALEEPSGKINAEQFGGITKQLGENLRDTMISEMNRLINEMDPVEPAAGSRQKRARPMSKKGLQQKGDDDDEDKLERLRRANERASEDVKTLVELTGDTTGALPQASLHGVVNSFGKRLQEAGTFVGNKLNSMGNRLKRNIPHKLRKFFVWPKFLTFKVRFNKVYKTLAEELYRQMVFLKSQVKVGMQHIRFRLGRDKFLTGQNQFSDITSREFGGMVHNPEAAEEEKTLPKVDDKTVAKLELLAAQGKNVHGFSMAPGVFRGSAKAKARRKRQVAARASEPTQDRKRRPRLFKRWARGDDGDVEMFDAEEDAEMSELDAEEEDYYDDEFDADEFLDGELQFNNVGNELLNENDFDSFDQFNLQSGFDAMDDLEDEMDEVLSGDKTIHPIDLRQNDCFADADNQEQCGACYAFSVNHMASYYRCMETREEKLKAESAFKSRYGPKLALNFISRPNKYSARFVSDCGTYMPEALIRGCKGGRAAAAFTFIRDVGQLATAAYNVAKAGISKKDKDGKEGIPLSELGCPYPAPKKVSAMHIEEHGWNVPFLSKLKTFEGANYTMIDFKNVDTYLQTNGPVLVNLRVWDEFKAYTTGIVNQIRFGEQTVIHSMLIVGVDFYENTKPYYIILNSHGIVWGQRGYLKIDRRILREIATSFAVVSPNLID